MDKSLIQKARQTNLADYLLSMGVPLIKNGHRYKHKEHDSLVFTKNAYYWNSKQENGNAIDYLVRHMNMSFKDAVIALTNSSTISGEQRSQTANENFNLDRTTLSTDNEKIYTYLHNTRFIGRGIIDFFIKKKLLYLETQTNNAFFLMRDEHENCVGAEIQGTTKKRFKGVKTNSKYGYGFNVKFSNDNTFDYALFFESAVDLLSFIDYKHSHDNKSLKRCILISMAGLKMNVLKHSLETFKGAFGVPEVVLCVDNDRAGQAFRNEVEKAGIKYIDKSPDKRYKDWNEQLIDAKLRNKPISRLINLGSEDNQGLTGRVQYKTEMQKKYDRNDR